MSESDELVPVEYSTRIENGRTVIDVTGETRVAVVIQSDIGERIYFPPEDMDERSRDDQDSPYQPADSPYQSDSPYQPADSPYQPSDDIEVSTRGVSQTATGFRITHPEPASEISVFRDAVAA